MIKTITITSTKYSQEGLDVSIKNNKLTVTKGKLCFDREYELDSNVSFTIDEKTAILFLVEELATSQVLVAISDGSIDKSQYRLIERLAWKKDEVWYKIKVKPASHSRRAGNYNYEGLNRKAIQKELKILKRHRKTIGPDGRIKAVRIKD